MTTTRNTPIAVIPKNSREELRIDLSNFNGHNLANLRVWYQPRDAAEGEMRPGRDGIAFQITKLSDVISALQNLQAEAKAQGLLD